MKHRFLLLSVLAIFVAGSIGIAYAYTELSQPSKITGKGTVPFAGPKALLDDFGSGTKVNAWNCNTDTFKSDTTSSCTASYNDDPAIAYGGTGHSLQLNYNVNTPNSYAGYYSLLGGGSLTAPTAYTAVSFYVRGAVGGEFFKVQLKNRSTSSYWDAGKSTYYFRNTASVYITDYLDGGVTTSWQKVTIPFYNFGNLDGFSSMAEFDIVFENSQSVTNGSQRQGIIYIDNITFETTSIVTARIDHFGDKLGVCSLGGNMGNGVGGGASASLNKYEFTNVSNEYSPYPNGMRLTYNITPGGSYSYVFILFGGGNTDNSVAHPEAGGWIAIPQNFNAFNYLTLRIRAASDSENPKSIKLEIVDGGGTKYSVLTGITTSWQYWQAPLSVFSGLDKTTIKQITFVFDPTWIPAGGSKSGVIYIDYVQFDVN